MAACARAPPLSFPLFSLPLTIPPNSWRTNKPSSLYKYHKTHLTYSSPEKTQQTNSTTIPSNSMEPHNLNSNLCNLCLLGNLDQALQILEGMKDEKFIVEEETYILLLKLCEIKREVLKGEVVCSHISSSLGLSPLSLRLGNCILSFYVRFGKLLDAWFVFGKMEDRDIFSWNVMLGGYAKNGFLSEAMTLYHQMYWTGIRPDVYTFPCVLRTCAAIPDHNHGQEVHTHFLRFGYESDTQILNALITMYSKCGYLSSAKQVFDKMVQRDRISWNALIAGYYENEECEEALKLFCEMRMMGMVEPNAMTMTAVISSVAMMGVEELGKEVHGYVIGFGLEPEVSISNALIQMYVDMGKLHHGLDVFRRMRHRDVVSWTAIISGYAKNGFYQKALNAFEEMRSEGTEPDEVTIAVVLSVYAELKLLDRGFKLHDYAKERGLLSYVIVANALIDMYSKCGCIERAVQIFKRMSCRTLVSWGAMIAGFRQNNRSFEALFHFRHMQNEFKPNSVTVMAALSACSKIGALQCGEEIHAHMLRNNVGASFEESNNFVWNALLDMYLKCGRIKEANVLFQVMGGKDVTSWNIMLGGCVSPGEGARALSLFREMEEAGFIPDEVTFVALLCACSRSGMVEEGMELFKSMREKHSVSRNLKHYACVVDLLGRAGLLEEARRFIAELPIEPDAALWGALLGACRIHGWVQLGEEAAMKIFELEPENVGYYSLFCEMYAAAERWDGVSRVRKLMHSKGLTVDPGCSWVEVKGTVHAFLSGDKTHPEFRKIEGVLVNFSEKMKREGQEVTIGDELEASKAEVFCGHSERMAVAFSLLNTVPGTPIWVTKNLHMCVSCHTLVKFITSVVKREITVRDANDFHHFRDGFCSCGDQGYLEGLNS
ncbi:hypothetical protein AMTRI_Chr05g58510 [Amborella trichopoda]